MLVAAHEAAGTPGDESELAADIGDLWPAGGIDCAGFIRAVRSAEDPGVSREGGADPLAVRYSVPDFVAAEWVERFGAEEAEALCAASNGVPPVSIRVNELKGGVEECRAALAREGIAASGASLSPVGLVFPKRINAQGLHAFRQGLFEMQDEGSQILSMLLEVHPGMTVIDACAGAGGKSLHMAAMMRNRGKILSLDVDPKKLENLVMRSRRAGVTIAAAEVVQENSPEPPSGTADAVMIDAPCSGVGTFRRNPGAKLLCTEEYSRTLAVRQRALLERYSRAVRSGGRLVYSTCTLLERENHVTAREFLAAHPEFSLLDAGEILARLKIPCPGQHTWCELFPHRTGTDGYFAAVMVRA
jgi:16S rRNA (cytosine967-C5)-methyltransferase